MSNSIIGVYASFSTDHAETDPEQLKKNLQHDQFKKYLWGTDDNDDGLSKKLKALKPGKYGDDLHLILIQFNVNPIESWPQPGKDIENYRRKEKSIGAWILIDHENYFSKNEEERQKYIYDMLLIRLEQIKEKFKASKLSVNFDLLIRDTKALLDS